MVPFAPGGGTDIIARLIGQSLGEAWSQTVVVDNRTGAGGVIGVSLVAKSSPDGYTMLLASNGQLSMAPWLHPKLPYAPLEDFVPITHFVDTPMVLFAHAGFAAKTVKELVAQAKAQPGTIRIGLSGVGGVSHLTMELFRQKVGITFSPVPYRGAGAAMVDVANGSVPLIFSTLAAGKGLLDAGRLRALAVSTAKRSPLAPEVPSLDEAGVPGYDLSVWFGVLAPAGTPREILQRLNTEIVKILQSPDVKARFLKQGVEVQTSTPEQFDKFVKAEVARWAKVIKDAGIRAD